MPSIFLHYTFFLPAQNKTNKALQNLSSPQQRQLLLKWTLQMSELEFQQPPSSISKILNFSFNIYEPSECFLSTQFLCFCLFAFCFYKFIIHETMDNVLPSTTCWRWWMPWMISNTLRWQKQTQQHSVARLLLCGWMVCWNCYFFCSSNWLFHWYVNPDIIISKAKVDLLEIFVSISFFEFSIFSENVLFMSYKSIFKK